MNYLTTKFVGFHAEMVDRTYEALFCTTDKSNKPTIASNTYWNYASVNAP